MTQQQQSETRTDTQDHAPRRHRGDKLSKVLHPDNRGMRNRENIEQAFRAVRATAAQVYYPGVEHKTWIGWVRRSKPDGEWPAAADGGGFADKHPLSDLALLTVGFSGLADPEDVNVPQIVTAVVPLAWVDDDAAGLILAGTGGYARSLTSTPRWCDVAWRPHHRDPSPLFNYKIEMGWLYAALFGANQLFSVLADDGAPKRDRPEQPRWPDLALRVGDEVVTLRLLSALGAVGDRVIGDKAVGDLGGDVHLDFLGCGPGTAWLPAHGSYSPITGGGVPPWAVMDGHVRALYTRLGDVQVHYAV